MKARLGHDGRGRGGRRGPVSRRLRQIVRFYLKVQETVEGGLSGGLKVTHSKSHARQPGPRRGHVSRDLPPVLLRVVDFDGVVVPVSKGRRSRQSGSDTRMASRKGSSLPSPSLVLPVPALLASHDVDAAVEHADAGPVAPLMHRADKVPRVLRNVVPLHLVRVLGRGMPTAC